MSSGINRIEGFAKKITPECQNMATTIVMSGMLELLFAVITIIISVVILYLTRTKSAMKDDDKLKRYQYGVYVLLGVGIVSTLVGTWHILISNKLKKCVSP